MNVRELILYSGIEITGVTVLFKFATLESLILYGLLHAVASFLTSVLFKTLLPKLVKKGSISSFFFLILFSGPAGFFLSVLVYIAINLRRIDLTFLYENVSHEIMPEVKFEGRKVGEASVQVINQHMVIYMSKAVHPSAIGYLRKAVSSEEDEIRLLAFARLTSIEKDIMEKISTLKEAIESAEDANELFSIHASLSELYWELVYLGISDRELEDFYLSEAQKHAMYALKIKEDPKIHFILGRLYLKRRLIDQAERHLLKAADLGFPKERVFIYLLEVLYLKKDFEGIFKLSEKCRDMVLPDPKAVSIVRVWV